MSQADLILRLQGVKPVRKQASLVEPGTICAVHIGNPIPVFHRINQEMLPGNPFFIRVVRG